ncbi:glycerophosphoryl diester phosphodiesterase [Candidatus Magnetoovum chiemensis]|nr:glycerophosphoryl diester phosphodiesterase [Candidatus Magnetoovum chiemensis]
MTKIIAHRGARSIAPENTIIAAETARLIGADLWETDVSITKDGQLILFHDDDLLRTTDVKEKFPNCKSFNVNDFTLAEIQALDLGAVFIEKDPFGEIEAGNIAKESVISFRCEKIPTLEQALQYTKDKNWAVNLELKEQGINFKDFPLHKKVIDMIRKMKVDPKLIIISSFNHKWLNDIKNLGLNIELQALLGDEPENKTVWHELLGGKCSFDTYNLDHTMVTIKNIEKIKNMGSKVNLYTVNDKLEMESYINAGVDGIFTDYPQLMKTLL